MGRLHCFGHLVGIPGSQASLESSAVFESFCFTHAVASFNKTTCSTWSFGASHDSLHGLLRWMLNSSFSFFFLILTKDLLNTIHSPTSAAGSNLPAGSNGIPRKLTQRYHPDIFRCEELISLVS